MAPKRQSKRWSQRLRVNVWEVGHDQQVVGYTENVSAGGLFLSVAEPLVPGARVRLEVLTDDQTYMCEGVVVHVRRVPRELQRVKQAGMGISLMPFEAFLSRAKASGMTQTGSGLWRMPEGVAAPAAVGSQEAESSGPPAAAPSPRPRPRPTPVSPPALAAQGPAASAPSPPLASAPRPVPVPEPRPALSRQATHLDGSRVDEHRHDSGGEDVYAVRFDDREAFVHCVDHDIKMGIFLVPTQVPAADHARVKLEFHIPGKEKPLRFAAEVVRGRQPGSRGGSAGIGMLVRFLEPAVVIRSLQLVAGNLRR